MNWRGIEQGKRNREAVRAFFTAHLCATNVECAKALGLSVMAVGRHVEAIRAEWKDAACTHRHTNTSSPPMSK